MAGTFPNTDETKALTESGAVTPIERELMKFGDETYYDFSRYRFAEEREWYELALFYQRRQWLSYNDQTRRWEMAKPDKKKPRPMPVSNYFAKTVNANANALGAELPKFLATPHDDDPVNRRAADMAQRAKVAIDRESGMKILNPLLAKHTALWGIGITRDYYDLSESNGVTKVPTINLESATQLACIDCAGTHDAPEGAPETSTGQVACPQCGSQRTETYPALNVSTATMNKYAKGKLCTEVVPIFEMFLPRDCRNPNLAKRLLRRSRRSVGRLQRQYPDKAQNIKADQQLDTQEIFNTALKSLVNYNYMQEQTQPGATCTEYECFWEEISKELQDTLTANLDPQTLEEIKERGMYCCYTPGVLLDWGVNPLYDETNGVAYLSYTFFIWELDPANVYNKSIGTDLVPLQKRLNRLDSLVELSFMCNAAGKWLWPKTQTTDPPNGSPNEVIEYQPMGAGKEKPEFIAPEPISGQIWTLRQTILGDFNALGLTEAVSQGATPAGGNGPTAFRAVAFLAQKASEQINTQRTLWELGHELRYNKCLLMAKMCWDEPRKVRTQGNNGRYKSQAITGADLQGSYDIEFVPDSSKPQTLAEKQAALAAMFQAGLVDVNDPATRDYIIDTFGMDGVNLVQHLQFSKAERVLDQVIRGEQPMVPPALDDNIVLGIFNNYTLTEEFEQQPNDVITRVLQFSAMIQMQIAQKQMQQAQAMLAAGAPPPGAPQLPPPGGSSSPQNNKQIGDALAHHVTAKHAGGNAMNDVPGPNNTDQIQAAAGAEGQNVASQLPS